MIRLYTRRLLGWRTMITVSAAPGSALATGCSSDPDHGSGQPDSGAAPDVAKPGDASRETGA